MAMALANLGVACRGGAAGRGRLNGSRSTRNRGRGRSRSGTTNGSAGANRGAASSPGAGKPASPRASVPVSTPSPAVDTATAQGGPERGVQQAPLASPGHVPELSISMMGAAGSPRNPHALPDQGDLVSPHSVTDLLDQQPGEFNDLMRFLDGEEEHHDMDF